MAAAACRVLMVRWSRFAQDGAVCRDLTDVWLLSHHKVEDSKAQMGEWYQSALELGVCKAQMVGWSRSLPATED